MTSRTKTILIITALVGLSIYAGFITFKQLNTKKSSVAELKIPSEAAKEPDIETKKVLEKVTSMIDVGTGETPTVATVTDIEKLKTQSFFKTAQNGDRVIVYAKARKVVLYRPDTQKIIDIAPINVNQAVAAPTPTGRVAGATTTVPVRVLFLNGTDTAGITNAYDSKVKSALSDSAIDRETADKKDYYKSTIFTTSDKFKDAATSIAKSLEIDLGSNPSSVDYASKADIIILIGADKK